MQTSELFDYGIDCSPFQVKQMSDWEVNGIFNLHFAVFARRNGDMYLTKGIFLLKQFNDNIFSYHTIAFYVFLAIESSDHGFKTKK